MSSGSATPIGEPLELCMGNKPGESFRVICDEPGPGVFKTGDSSNNVVRGMVPRLWTRVFVLTGRTVRDEKHYRFFELVPSMQSATLEHGEFFVKGAFEIVTTINNAREAREMWKRVRARIGIPAEFEREEGK